MQRISSRRATRPPLLVMWLPGLSLGLAIISLLWVGMLRYDPDVMRYGLGDPGSDVMIARIARVSEVHALKTTAPPERPMGKRMLSQAVGKRLKSLLRMPDRPRSLPREVQPSVLQSLRQHGPTRAVLGLVHSTARSGRELEPTLVLTVVQQAVVLDPTDPFNPRRGVVEVYRRRAGPFLVVHSEPDDPADAETVSGDWALCARQVLPGTVELTTPLDDGAAVAVLVRYTRPEDEQSSALVRENDDFCTNNDEFCINNDEFCINNDEFHLSKRLLLYNHTTHLPQPKTACDIDLDCHNCEPGSAADGGVGLKVMDLVI